MTPAEYREDILPKVLDHCTDTCICDNIGIRKLISFNFEDYGMHPLACADSEILIQELLRATSSVYTKEMVENSWVFTCRICGASLLEGYNEYSISMNRSFIRYAGAQHTIGNYMIGFYGFALSQIGMIHDFMRVDDKNTYFRYLGVP